MENKEYYRELFPLLTDYELIPNSEDNKYNCISHTIGIKDKYYWPYEDEQEYYFEYSWSVKNEISNESFDEFYKYHGFEKMDLLNFFYDPKYIKVALYTNNGIPTHAAIQVDDVYWESKVL
jgi:hypothetical protein